jgi:pyrimidine-nucleoside phosphorylase
MVAYYKACPNIVKAQGADPSLFEAPAAHHKPTATRTLTSPTAGYLAAMDCKQVGWAVQRLGAGRAEPGAPVSAHAGIEMHAKLGDKLEPDQPLVTLFAEDSILLDEPEAMLRETLEIKQTPPRLQPLIREIITKTISRAN